MDSSEPHPADKSRNPDDDLPLFHQLRPVTRKCYLIVSLFVAIIGCILVLTYVQTEVLNAVRAYVGGEGLWAKAQKGAMYDLGRYAATGDERFHHTALTSLAVPLGDRRARMELQQSAPDMAIVREGLLAGLNHPDDTAAIAWFFLRFQHVEQMAEAIAIWTEGDRLVEQTLQLAGELREATTAGDDGRAADIMARIDAVQRDLTTLENRFSATLSAGARQLLAFTRWLTCAIAFVLVATGLYLSWRTIQGIQRTERALMQSELRFRRVVEADLVGIFFTDSAGRILEANDTFLGMLGYTRDDMLDGRLDCAALTPAEYRAVDAQAMDQRDARGACDTYEKEFIARDGTRVAVYFGTAALDDSQAVCFTLDVTARRQSEQQLRLSSKVFEGSSEGIIITDAEARIISVNRAFTEITGFERDEVVGRNPRILKSGSMSAKFYRDMWRRLLASGHWDGEIYDRRKNGEIYPKWLSIDAVKDPAGEVTHYVAIFSDISERKAAQERLRHQAEHDALTGLPNRGQFAARLNRALAYAERQGTQVAVMFIDLDHFKAVNDTYGHLVGDGLLRHVAERLTACVRKSDTVSRQGGDEFVAILEDVSSADVAAHIAVKLLAAVGEPFDIDGHRLHISPSIGISLYPQDGGDMTSLMHSADAAMYRAKTEGRNRFRFYAPPAIAARN